MERFAMDSQVAAAYGKLGLGRSCGNGVGAEFVDVSGLPVAPNVALDLAPSKSSRANRRKNRRPLSASRMP